MSSLPLPLLCRGRCEFAAAVVAVFGGVVACVLSWCLTSAGRTRPWNPFACSLFNRHPAPPIRLQVGPCTDFTNFMGPVINQAAYDRITGIIEDARDGTEGSGTGRLVMGGDHSDESTLREGWWSVVGGGWYSALRRSVAESEDRRGLPL